MKISRDVLAIVSLVALSGPSWSQVVQLPTRRMFAVGTSVSVPDRGQAFLGGINRARSASTSRGVPVLGRLPGIGGALQSRAVSRSMGTGQAHVGATIIDLNAMDQAILAQAPTTGTQDANAAWFTQRAEFLTRHVDRNVTSPEHQPADTVQSQHATKGVDGRGHHHQRVRLERQNEALDYISRSQSALARGKNGAARAYLRMAARRADGSLRDRVLAALSSLSTPKPVNR